MADRSSKHRTIAVDVDAAGPPPERQLPWPWWVIATFGAVAVLAAGWLLLAGAAALGWLTSPDSQLPSALDLASRMLVLAHGAPVDVGGQLVSLVPLLMTGALVVLGQPAAALAARQAAAAEADPDDTGQLWVDAQPLVVRVAGTYAATYALAVALLAGSVGGSAAGWRAALGGVVLGGVAGWWGAARELGVDLRDAWPGWLRAVPTAVGIAVLVCIAGGAAVLATALIQHRDRIAAIHDGLDPGAPGTVLLVLAQILYLPNLVLWAAAWAVGGGVTLGDGSLLNLTVTDVGFLPAIPAFGAVPDPGAGASVQLWWLGVGVLAGAVAAAVVALARPRARFDETALVGGLSGVVTGLVLVVACSLASGGLGSQRLAHLGARVTDLAIVAPSLLGLSGLLTGLVVGLLRRRPSTQEVA